MSRLRTVSWKSRCDRILDQSTSGSFGRSASVADVSISHLRTSSIAPGFILSRTAFTLTWKAAESSDDFEITGLCLLLPLLG
jgi:hypothetical protein